MTATILTLHLQNFCLLAKLKFCTLFSLRTWLSDWRKRAQPLAATFLPSVSMNLNTLGPSYMWNQTVFVLLRLVYFTLYYVSRFIQVVACVRISFFFMTNIPFYAHIPYVIYWMVIWIAFTFLAIVKDGAMNMGMQIPLWDSALFWVYV